MNARRHVIAALVLGACAVTASAGASVPMDGNVARAHPVAPIGGPAGGVGPDPRLVMPNGDAVPAWERDLVVRLERLRALGAVHRGVRKTVAASALRKRRVQAAQREAILRHRRGDRIGAMLSVGRALRTDPGHPALVGLHARLLLVDGRPQAALAMLQRSGPGTPELLALQGVAALASRQWVLALGVYRELLQVEPRDARWWSGLGFALQGSGQAQAAERAWRNAIALGAHNPALVQLAAAARRTPTFLAAAGDAR